MEIGDTIMKVKLLNYTPLSIADTAIGKCWDKETANPLDRMYRVGIKFKHASTLEHINYSFDIDGISRAALQELARHRIASLSVKSSRYTLKELKTATDMDRFFVHTGVDILDRRIYSQLFEVKEALVAGYSNDIVKYMLPEAYKTSLVWTINMRSLQNFLSLRTDKAALREMQDLAWMIYERLPTEHLFMYKDFVKCQ